MRVAVLLVAVAAAGGVANADQGPFAHLKPKKAKAIEAMKEANAFYRRSRAALTSGDKSRANKLRQAAVALYQRSLAIEFSPLVAFNLAQVNRELGNHDEAITSYELFLASKKVSERLRADVRLRIAATRAEKAAAEKARTKEPSRTPEPQAKSRPATASKVVIPVRSRWYQDRAGWAIVSVGLVGTITGGGFMLRAAGLHGEADRELVQEDKERIRKKADGYQLVGRVLFGAGVAVIAGGVIKLALHGKRSNPRTSVLLGPKFVLITKRF